ncbi:MAG: dihydroxyacetone kinase phosphoryl donor subunit DhaM [Escherichia coli]
MVNLVIVSHSSRLGEGVGELARQMLMSDSCKIAIAAGIDDPQNPIGTDAVKVMEAIESVADADHVLVMMDMGSALLSAETALELLARDRRKSTLCVAPLVEVHWQQRSARPRGDIDKVIFDAMHALEAKREQLGLLSSDTEISDTCPPYDEEARSLAVVIKNRNGLHVRPASRLVYTLSTFNADMLLEKNGKCVTPESINQIALLQVRYNDTLRLIAKGPEAEEALIAFRQLAEDNFGETEEVVPPTLRPVPPVSGKAFYYQPVLCTVQAKSTLTVEEEQERLRQAIDFTLLDLMTLTAKAEASGLDDIAAIFSGHHTLLDDPELLAAASELLQHEHCTAEYAWQQVLKELSQQYQQLDDEYLQARYIDVDDLLHRTLVHLTQTKELHSLTRQLFYWRRTFILHSTATDPAVVKVSALGGVTITVP